MLTRAASLCLAACACLWGATLAVADEATDLAGVIVGQVEKRLPDPAPRLTEAEKKNVTLLARAALNRSYYPTSPTELRATALKAIDKASDSADSNTAARIAADAMTAVVNSVGHGARVYDLGKPPSPRDAPATAQLTVWQVGAIRVVSLPNMMALGSYGAFPRRCLGIGANFAARPGDTAKAVVLDLRGNDGGVMEDVTCLASLFVDSPVPLGHVVMKAYPARELVADPRPPRGTNLPLAVLIDRRTDNGGLMIAALLQYYHRAVVLGELKHDVVSSVYSLFIADALKLQVMIPVGEMRLPDDQALATSIHVDIPVTAGDDGAVVKAAARHFHLPANSPNASPVRKDHSNPGLFARAVLPVPRYSVECAVTHRLWRGGPMIASVRGHDAEHLRTRNFDQRAQSPLDLRGVGSAL
jgi:Peptidase family S41